MGNKSYSKGISWFDDCRIPFVDKKEIWTAKRRETNNPFHLTINKDGVDYGNTQGRFPANILVSDDMLNDGSVIQYNKNRTDNGTYLGGHRKEYVGTDDNDVIKQIKGQFFNDKGTNSRYYDIDKWFDNLIDV